MSLYINEASNITLEAVFKASPHAILLTGQPGIGLAEIAKQFAKQSGKVVRIVLPEKDEAVNLEKGTITIDIVRKLYMETQLIEPKGRVVIIDYAERMASAAQNAFLKLLEEPGKDTQFVLLTHNPERLLPTVISRVQRIDVRPITLAQSEALLDALDVKDATLRTQLLFVAKGLPAALTRYVNDAAAFEARAGIVRDAREYTQGNAYQKLKVAYKCKDSRETALLLLSDAMKMVQGSLTRHQDERASLRLLQKLEQIHLRITEQGNVRLQLSSVVMLQ